jgi:hypothetical protein
MPAAIALAPMVVQGISALKNRKKNNAANDLAAQNEQQGQQQQQGISQALLGQGDSLASYGQSKLNQGGNYFSQLASGNRGATTQMLAPDVENINKTYGGTGRTLSRFLRGPERDMQLGELERERAGGVSSLFRNSRSDANKTLIDLGKYGQSSALDARSNAGMISGNMSQQGLDKRAYGDQKGRQEGQDFGGLLFNFLTAATAGKSAWGMGSSPGAWQGPVQ